MKIYKYDSEIADLVLKTMGNGTMIVETIDEALLVKFFELRGTPLRYKESLRNIEKDWEREMGKESLIPARKCCGSSAAFGKCGRGEKDGCTGIHCKCMQNGCTNMHYVECKQHYIHVE